jgi:hypothetical protein
MFASAPFRATVFAFVLAIWGIGSVSCSLNASRQTEEFSLGALPAMVMAFQQADPKADYGPMVLNPPRSTLKFTGNTSSALVLETRIETPQPVSFHIAEENPGHPGLDGKYASFSVTLGPNPNNPQKAASGVLHQSDPYFYLESGWAYFAGSAALGATPRFRTTPDATVYFIQIDESDPNQPIHRVINVSSSSMIVVTCPNPTQNNPQDPVNSNVSPCYYIEFPTNDCKTHSVGQISGNAAVQKFLESVGYNGNCYP